MFSIHIKTIVGLSTAATHCTIQWLFCLELSILGLLDRYKHLLQGTLLHM